MATTDQVRGALNKGSSLSSAVAMGNLVTAGTDAISPNAVYPANAAYTLADQSAMALLVNELKTDLNALRIDFNALLTALK